MSLLDQIPGVAYVKNAILIAAVIGLVGAGIYIKYKLNELQTLQLENTILAQNNKVLEENVKIVTTNFSACSSSNASNLATIDSLKLERSDAWEAIARLNDKNKANSASMTELSKRIEHMRKDPTNDGSVSPILRETLKSIQDKRDNK